MKKLIAVGVFLVIMLSQLCAAHAHGGWYDSLLDAADVDKTAPTDKQQLIWDDTLQKWFSDYVQGADIVLDTTLFDNNLGPGDSDLQTAMETLDELVAAGDVTGPVASTDHAIVRWDGAGGDTLLDSSITIDDSNNLAMPTDKNITLGTSTIQEDSTKADIVVTNDIDIEDPHGHLGFRDTDTDGAAQLHYDGSAVAAPYQEFSLWLGTDDGTGFEKAGLPYIHITTAAGVDFPGSVTVGDLTVDAAVGTSGYVRIKEDPANGTNYISLNAPSSITVNRDWTLADIIVDLSSLADDDVLTFDLASKTVSGEAAAGGGEFTDEGAYLRPNDGNEYIAASDTGSRDYAAGDGDGYFEDDLEVDGEIYLVNNSGVNWGSASIVYNATDIVANNDFGVSNAVPAIYWWDTNGEDFHGYAENNIFVFAGYDTKEEYFYCHQNGSIQFRGEAIFDQPTTFSAAMTAGQVSASQVTVTGGSTGSAFAAGITIDEGTDHHIRFTGDSSNATPVDGDLWWTGTALNFYNGASTTNLLTVSAGDAWGDPVDANILPTGADDTYDIGGVGAEFKDGFFDGTLEGDVITEGGNAVYSSGETPSGELGGTYANITIDDSVAVTSWNLTTPTITTSLTTSTPTTISVAELDRLDGLAGIIVTDVTAVTDIEGTGLSIGGATLNWSAASTDLTDTADLLYETELDDFAELQAQVADKTLVNEEDVFTIDADWVNTANPWAANEITEADPLVDSEAEIEAITGALFGASKVVTAGYIWVADGTDFESVVMSGDITIASGGATTIGGNKVQLAELDVSDVSDDIAGDIAEGELANAIIVSADVKADDLTHANIADSDQTITICIWFEDPVATDDFKSIWANKTANDFLLTEIFGESDQTVNFDLQIDDGSPADVSQVDISPAAGEAEDTSLDGDTTLAAGEELDLAITSVAGTPTWVSICWTGNWVD